MKNNDSFHDNFRFPFIVCSCSVKHDIPVYLRRHIFCEPSTKQKMSLRTLPFGQPKHTQMTTPPLLPGVPKRFSPLPERFGLDVDFKLINNPLGPYAPVHGSSAWYVLEGLDIDKDDDEEEEENNI